METAEFAVDAYDALLARAGDPEGSMPAVWIPGRGDALFAVSDSGAFYLLIRLSDAGSTVEKRLDAIRMNSGGEFVLSDSNANEPITDSFASVVLEPQHRELLTSFSTLSAVLLATLNEEPSRSDVLSFLNSFLELFAPHRVAERSTVVGLWGELWLITQDSSRNLLHKGWHMSAVDRFDFSMPSVRIEVKTTESGVRVHSFALGQLLPDGKECWIASITVVADVSGTSVADLLSEVLAGLSPDDRPNVARKCLDVLQGDLESASDFRFALSGEHPLALLPASQVPRVVVPAGAPISSVSFEVDVTDLAVGSTYELSELLSAKQPS